MYGEGEVENESRDHLRRIGRRWEVVRRRLSSSTASCGVNEDDRNYGLSSKLRITHANPCTWRSRGKPSILRQSVTLKKESKAQPNCYQKVNEGHSQSTQESNNAGDPVCTQSSLPKRSTTPLTGNPYFTSVVAKSQVERPYELTIPKSFHESLPNATLQVVLTYQGKSWDMKYSGECLPRRFGYGWKKFALDNNLKIGDGCVFELMDDKELKLGVQILDGQIPFEFIKVGCAEKPIYLD